MKIIFMGTPDYAKEILKTLVKTDNMDVVAVYTQPDKPVGRKKIMTPPSVKVLAQEKNIQLFQPKTLRDEAVVQNLLTIPCDFIVVAAYGQILPKKILNHATCINLHASVLPQYRGASPIQQTLLNGDKLTGVTAMMMEEGLDTGDIIKIQTLKVSKNELVESLFDKLTTIACLLSVEVLENFASYKIVKQDNTLATHCEKITKADGEVDLVNAEEIYNKYRAFTVWPGIYLNNGLKLKKIELQESDKTHTSGTILSIDTNSIIVGCEKGSIRLFSVQAPSKKEVEVLSYINGKRLKIDDKIS